MTLFIAKKKQRKKREKYHVYPKHSDTLPYLPQEFDKAIQLSVYLSKNCHMRDIQ